MYLFHTYLLRFFKASPGCHQITKMTQKSSTCPFGEKVTQFFFTRDWSEKMSPKRHCLATFPYEKKSTIWDFWQNSIAQLSGFIATRKFQIWKKNVQYIFSFPRYRKKCCFFAELQFYKRVLYIMRNMNIYSNFFILYTNQKIFKKLICVF